MSGTAPATKPVHEHGTSFRVFELQCLLRCVALAEENTTSGLYNDWKGVATTIELAEQIVEEIHDKVEDLEIELARYREVRPTAQPHKSPMESAS